MDYGRFVGVLCLIVAGCDDSAPPGDDGGGDICEGLSGELLTSAQLDQAAPSDLVLDPTSDAGEFYVSYSGVDCVSRHSADGQELWRLPGDACDQLAVDSAGDLLLAGLDNTNDGSRITKRNSDGEELWTHILSEELASELRLDVAVDPDDNVLVMGSDPFSDEGGWVTKLDASGAEQWTVVLGGRTVEKNPPSVATSANGDVTVGYALDGEDADGLVRVSRYDAAGQEQWSVDFPGPSARLDAMDTDDTGRVIVGLYVYDEGGPRRSLALLSAQGTLEWTRSTDDTPSQLTSAVAFAPCDTIVMAGGADPASDASELGRQLWVTKLDSDGTPLWANFTDGPLDTNHFSDGIRAIAVDAAGQITAAGVVTVEINPSQGEEFPVNDTDLWFGRFDA